MSSAALEKDPQPAAAREPVLQAKGLVKRYGKVTAIASGDLELYPGEILAVIGDNGAGKTSLIKALCGALDPGRGRDPARRQAVHFKQPDGRPRRRASRRCTSRWPSSPGLDIADNLFLGREERKPGVLGSVFRMLDKKHMKAEAARHMSELGVATLQNIGAGRGEPLRWSAPGRRGGPRRRRSAARSSSSTSPPPRWASRRATGCSS